MSTVTVCPLSAKALAAKLTVANSMFSGGPLFSMISRGLPVVKLTEVSDGGGPEVSSTITRASGKIRGAVGPAGVVLATGRRAPHAQAGNKMVKPRRYAVRRVWAIRQGKRLEVRSERVGGVACLCLRGMLTPLSLLLLTSHLSPLNA